MRRGLFFKFLGLTVAFGLLLDAFILAFYYTNRRDQLVGEMAAEVGTLATKLARPLARVVEENQASARDLLGVFAGLPYLVCVDFRVSAVDTPTSWPRIGCARMKPGLDLSVPAPLAGQDAHYDIRLDDEVLVNTLLQEFSVLAALALSITAGLLLAAAFVFHRIINRPLRLLVEAMTRFEEDNIPQKIAWQTRDEMGEVANRFNTMLNREVARVAEIEENRRKLADLVERLEEAHDEAHLARTKAEHALEDLQKAQDRLIQTEKMASLGQLTAGVAHEIKNPLNFVNNFASLSRELLDELKQIVEPAVATLDQEARDDAEDLIATLDSNLEKVNEHGTRADRIIRNMLLHSRQDTGTRSQINVNDLVEESLNLAYHGARAEDGNFQIKLERDFSGEAGTIDAYPQELQRVLVNLFSNGFYAACKRSDDGVGDGFEPTLTVSTVGHDHEVEIHVRDNGIGIPDDVKSKMFAPFFTTKPPGEGTGLGLSLSHDIIVKQHGGSFSVASEVGHFTEFTVIVPRSAP